MKDEAPGRPVSGSPWLRPLLGPSSINGVLPLLRTTLAKEHDGEGELGQMTFLPTRTG
jgi:hypothetical protein